MVPLILYRWKGQLEALILLCRDVCLHKLCHAHTFFHAVLSEWLPLPKSAQGVPKSQTMFQKNIRNPNHHYFPKKYRNTPPICIAVLSVPLRSET